MKKLSFFPKIKIEPKNIRLIELFAGIGAQAKALENLGIDFEHYRICEFDKYAVNSYNAVHHTNFETSDITKITANDLGIVDTDKYTYIMTYSFPCTDLSLAGKRLGMRKDSNTRSSLLWEVERLLNECEELPQILLMENVPQIVNDSNIKDFNVWCDFLSSKGYRNKWAILNAKNYGIPQNRERCFMLSWRDPTKSYQFPAPIKLDIRLKDVLEKQVDEKYYLSDEKLSKISHWNSYQKPLERVLGYNSISPTLTARGAGEEHSGMVLLSDTLPHTSNLQDDFANIQVVGNYMESGHDASRIVDTNGVEPTVKENHDTVTAIVEPFIVASRGRNPDNPSDRTTGCLTEQRLEPNFSGCTNTLTTVQKDNYVCETIYDDEIKLSCIGGIGEKNFCGSRIGMVTKEHQTISTLEQYLYLKNNGFEFDGYSYLFWEYVRLLKEIKPKYFLLENVRMAHKWEKIISNALGCEPIHLNSKLVSAQSRERLYWTNIPYYGTPEDKHIYLEDIIQTDIEHKYLNETRLDYKNYDKDKVDKSKHKYTAINIGNSRQFGNSISNSGKAFTLRRINPNGILDENHKIRHFTPIECERLQTLPDNYTLIDGIKDVERFEALGNCWTVDIIAHLFKGLLTNDSPRPLIYKNKLF